MNSKLSATLAIAIFLVSSLMFLAPASASPTKPHSGSFVNASGVPAGSTLVLKISLKVTNDEDSGFKGYWALDNYNKEVQVWHAPDGTFYAVVRYEGNWNTFATAPSPEAGTAETRDATGTFEGGYIATFDAPGFTSTFGNIGTHDYGGTQADVLAQTHSITPFSYLDTYFSGWSNFNYINWGWTYHFHGQTWYNFNSGSSGDIVV